MASSVERVHFRGSQGTDLAARLDMPAGPARAMLLVAHCFTCSKESAAASTIAREFVAQGYGVLRFDFTGQGDSDGEIGNAGFVSNVDDVVLAAHWLAENHRPAQLLVGHSLGGAAVLAAAGLLPSVRAVATIGAPSDLARLSKLFDDGLGEVAADGSSAVAVAGRSFRVGGEFLEQLSGVHLCEIVARLDRPVLLMHSPVDATVPFDHAVALFEAAGGSRSLVSLDGADHLLTDRSVGAEAARVAIAWAARYLDDERGLRDAPTSQARVVVAETGQGKFLNHVVSGDHRFFADEPVSFGGFDAGPSPYDLLAAALGACTSMTIRMYADRKGWPLDRVHVEVDHAKVHADDSQHSESPRAKIDQFERVLFLDGDLDAEQRRRLVEIADRCPVHRTLESSSRIVTRLDG